MKLYAFPPSPNVRKVQAVAEHLGIPLELQVVDLPGGGQRQPEYLKLNPNGMIPTLQDGDFVLWESNAIMQYLAGKKPGNSLWPSDERQRADVARWQFWDVAHWGPTCGIFLFQNLVKRVLNLGDPDPVALKDGAERFERFGGVLDSHLANRDFIVGRNATLADFSVASYLAFAEPSKMPVGKFANIRRWNAGLDRIEAWKKTAPGPIPG